MSVFVAMRLSSASSDATHRNLLGSIVRAATVMLFWFSLLAVGLRGAWGIPWLVALLVLGLLLWRKRRRLERKVLFQAAIECDVGDRDRMLQCFKDEQVGQLPRRARRLEKDLRGGLSWGYALERNRVGRAIREIIQLRLLDRYGSAEAMRSGDIETISALRIESEIERIVARFAMFGWVFWALPAIIMTFTFVAPTFVAVFDEFGIEMPASLQFVFEGGSKVIITIVSLTIVAILFLALLVTTVWAFPSVLRTFPFRLLCGDYLRCMGFITLDKTIESEPDMPAAFAAVGEVLPVDYLAERFRVAGEMLESGHALPNALEKSRLIGPVEQARFGITLDGPDAVWSLRQFTTWRVERMIGRYNLAVQIAVIALTLLLGLVVGLFSYGFIQALAEIIHSVT